MDKRTADALEASIKHWEETLAAEKPNDVKMLSDSCALCALFNNKSDDDHDDSCIGCPVMDATRRPDCAGSPWVDAFRALTNWQRNDPISEVAKAAWRTAAKAELDFLISLRSPSDAMTPNDTITIPRADYTELLAALRTSRKYVVRCIDVHDEGADEHLAEIDAVLAKVK